MYTHFTLRFVRGDCVKGGCNGVDYYDGKWLGAARSGLNYVFYERANYYIDFGRADSILHKLQCTTRGARNIAQI